MAKPITVEIVIFTTECIRLLLMSNLIEDQFASDYDEIITTTYSGPLLIEKSRLSPLALKHLESCGARTTNGFMINIGERSDLLDSIPGFYCAYYSRQIILTLEKSVANQIHSILGL